MKMSLWDYLDKHVSDIKLFGFFLAFAASSFSKSFCAVGLGVYVFGLIFQWIRDKGSYRLAYPNSVFLIVLLASLTVSLFVSDYFWVSFRGFWKFMEGFILLYAGIDVLQDQKNMRWMVRVLAIVFFLSALAGIWQDVFGHDFIYLRKPLVTSGHLPSRITGAFKHYNDFGTFLVPGFAIAAALFLENWKSRKKVFALLSIFLFLALSHALARSMSRSALLAVFVSLFFFVSFFRFRWSAFMSLIILIVLLWLVPSPISSRLENLTSESGPERLLLLKTSFAMVKESPFFGLGINTYSDNFPRFKPQTYPALMYAHNSYMQMAAEIGLVGLFFYLLFIASFLWRFIRAIVSNKSSYFRTLNVGVVSGIAGLLFNALFESLLQSTQLRTLFWSLMGIAAALTYNLLLKGDSLQPRAK